MNRNFTDVWDQHPRGPAGSYAVSRVRWEDKDQDGVIDFLPGEANELFIDNDIVVLANPEIAGLPGWLIAFVVAGGLAAALSTASGLLLVIASSVSHDIYKGYINPEANDDMELRVARLAIVGAVFIAGYLGIYPPGFVGEVVAFAFGLAAASFFPAIVLGIFDKRTNTAGAVSGMLVGLVFTTLYIVTTAPKLLGWDPWLFGINPQGIGTVGMALNAVITIVVSRLTPPPGPEVQELVE